MTATLQVLREGFGIELRRGTFHVVLDGRDLGTIERHQTVEVPLEPGHHELRITAGKHGSPAHGFDAADEEVVNFRCHGAALWPVYVASILKRDWAIQLTRQ